MITRPSTRSHICLSCQRHLAKRNYSNSTKQFPDFTSSRSNDNDVQSKRIDMLAARELAHRRLENAQARTLRNTEAIGGKRSMKYKHGRRKTENVEELKVPRLGEESAKVIVLRDSLVSTYLSDQVPHDMHPVKPRHIDILGQLKEEQGLIEDEELLQNFEDFRPQKGEIFSSWDEINDLVDRLNYSFTTQQMEKYIETFSEQKNIESSSATSSRKKSLSISKVTPWLPGESDIQEYFDSNSLRGYSMESHTAKQRVAMRLLRECWQVELQEVTDGIGQFEIYIRSADLELLLTGRQSAIDILHAEHLALENEKLEVFRSRSAIRITTTNSKREWIIQQVRDALHRIQREKLPLGMFFDTRLAKTKFRKIAERTFDDPTIQELARLTNIQVARPKHDLIQLSCAGKDEGYSDNRMTDARRLILMAGDISERINRRVVRAGNSHGSFVSYPWVGGLNWWARLRTWYRRTSPMTKDSTASAKAENEGSTESGTAISFSSQQQPLPHLDSQTKTIKPTTMENEKNISQIATDLWATQYSTHTLATMGAVLHNSPSSNDVGLFPAKNTPKHLIHEFSTHVPHLTRLISSRTDVTQQSPELILRFKSNPFQMVTREGVRGPIGSAIFSTMPLIEFHLTPGDGSNWKLNDVIAVVEETQTSVMLPEKAVDVRFEQRVISRLHTRDRGQIVQYLKKCVLKSGHVQIWPSVKLPISKHLCRGNGLKLLELLSSKDGDDGSAEAYKPPTDNQEVDYLFSGFEIRKALQMEYKGCTLLFADVNAGKSGGNRQELKLRPTLKGKVMKENDFVNLAFEVADIVGGQKEKVEEPVTVRSVQSSPPIRKIHSEVDTPAYRYFPKRIELETIENEIIVSDTATNGEVIMDSEEGKSNDEVELRTPTIPTWDVREASEEQKPPQNLSEDVDGKTKSVANDQAQLAGTEVIEGISAKKLSEKTESTNSSYRT